MQSAADIPVLSGSLKFLTGRCADRRVASGNQVTM